MESIEKNENYGGKKVNLRRVNVRLQEILMAPKQVIFSFYAKFNLFFHF